MKTYIITWYSKTVITGESIVKAEDIADARKIAKKNMGDIEEFEDKHKEWEIDTIEECRG